MCVCVVHVHGGTGISIHFGPRKECCLNKWQGVARSPRLQLNRAPCRVWQVRSGHPERGADWIRRGHFFYFTSWCS